MTWQTAAACGTAQSELFMPLTVREMSQHGGEAYCHPRIREAFRLCAGCPVRAECLNDGLENGETGVWGGQYLSQHPRSRAKLRKAAA